MSPLTTFESQLSSGFNSAFPSGPPSPTPMQQSPAGTTVDAKTTPAKPKKKRRPKPRMCDLNDQQAKVCCFFCLYQATLVALFYSDYLIPDAQA